jgi:signal transduction histidine kinase
MKAWWGLVLLPVAAGVTVAVLAGQGVIENPVLYLRGRLDLCAVIAGVTLSFLAAAFLGLTEWLKGRGRRATQRALEQTAREHNRFLRRLDHELKNPLTALRNQLARELAANPSPEQETALRALEVQVLRLSRLTEDLGALAELESYELRIVRIDVDELLAEAEALVENLSGAGDRKMVWLVPRVPVPPSFPGDWDLVAQSVHNVLTNAIKFTRPGDRIEVRASDLGDWVAIQVADTGPGVPEEEIPHLGEELFRGAGAHDVPGSGLGLALVRSIVARHKGQWEIISPPAGGTTVTMRFPKE